MTIEIGYFFNDIYDSAYSSNLRVLFTNIFYTSLIISIIILLIICFTYPCRKGTPLYVTFKLVFYVFIFVLGILVIHQGVMEKSYEEKYNTETNKNILEAVRGGSINSLFGSGKKIKINPFINKNTSTINEELPMEHMQEKEEYTQENEQTKVSGTTVEEMLNDLGA